MEKKRSILQKLNDLVRQFPRYLHHYGPKKFTTWQHLKCIFLKEKLKCNYKTLLEFLPYFGVKNLPERTTLIKFRKRVPAEIWQNLLGISAELNFCDIGAIDSTGFSRNNASSYYVKRIDRDVKTQRHIQASLYVAINERKILSARIRAKPVGDNIEVPYLVNKSPCIAETNLMDKGYDSNDTHAFFRDKGKYSIIPVRKGCVSGRFRKEMRDYFDYCQYWQRNIIESINSAVKRTFGSVCKGKSFATQRAEIFCRLILFNLSLTLARLFHLSHPFGKI